MGKKKPFVDRKTASVYHVVRRSRRDVAGEGGEEVGPDDGGAATGDGGGGARGDAYAPPSEFVLVADPDNERRRRRREDEGRAEVTRVSNAGGTAATTKDAARERSDFDALASRAARLGLLDSSASTYAKFTKPINNAGAFLSAETGPLDPDDAAALGTMLSDPARNALDEALAEAMEVKEQDRMLESVALNADCMEEDVATALFEFEEGEFEEILDDFCLTANQEKMEVEEGQGQGEEEDAGEFDYERHIRALMERARAEEEGEDGGRELEGKDDFFAGATPLHGRVEEEDDEDDFDYDQYNEDEEEDSLDREFNVKEGGSDANPALDDERQRVLCQKFEEALLEYDSDEVGDLDDECEEIVGDRPLEGDAGLEAALDEFLVDKEDEVLMEGTTKKFEKKKRTGGSGYSALVGKTMVGADALAADPAANLVVNVEESKERMRADLAEADAVLANPEMDLPPEEILIDGKSYFSATPRNPWDCESILSTYSNLDNNPAVIGRSDRKKKKKKKKGTGDGEGNAIPEDGPTMIRLSDKTGLPLGTFDDRRVAEPEEDCTYLSVNLGEARSKSESKLEKQNRKAAVKEERRICRMQKKMMKEAFADEFRRRGELSAADAVGGTAVFRFS
ncbi:hypothetical protein ACHAWF_003889 [Thalassiosira exigua]